MKQLRWRIIMLVCWLAFLFNVERIDVDPVPNINLSWWLYALTVLIVTVFLLVPFHRKHMYLASLTILVTYVGIKALHVTPFFNGIHKYVTITEIGLLMVTAFLAWLVSQSLFDFKGAVEAISMPEGRAQLLSFDKIQDRIRAEMGRARRHQRPISITMIDLDSATFEAALHQAVREAQEAMIQRYVQVRLGLFLSRRIRGTDMIGYYPEGGRFLLVTPETPAEQAGLMVRRLEQQVSEQLGIRFRYSIADFPNGALTSEEMIRKVTEDLQYGPANDSAPSVVRLDPTPESTTAQPAKTLTYDHDLVEK